jgi:hypothetical protein
MSDIALVMVEATQANVGNIDIWPDDYHLFSEDVQSDDVLIVHKPTDKEYQNRLMELSSHNKPAGEISEVVKPFWAFRLTAIGDWIWSSVTNPVNYVVDNGFGWERFQDDTIELVKIAERIQSKDSNEDPNNPCPYINFVVAYEYAQDVISTEYGDEINDSWCELLGEVDLDKIPQIIKGTK